MSVRLSVAMRSVLERRSCATARAPRAGLALLVTIGALASGLVSARDSSNGAPVTYRWVDENGVVHYGDHVPPQYSQHESSILNHQGVEIGRLAAPKSAGELMEDARIEQQRLQQKQRDGFLLSTYSSVKEIEQLRDERLSQLHGQRVAAEQYVASLNERLLGLQARAMTYKPYSSEQRARRMPDDLAEDIVRTLNEMRVQRSALATKDQQESSIRTEFQADIERFQELRTAKTPEQ